MAFTSYAQNFEDVMLWRALKHIEKGRYVDIGAQHPIVDSVSKAFYMHGWRGIHVEPVRYYADLLREDRPGETVLEMAISDKAGVLELNMIPDSGLSTGVKEYAESHQRLHGFEHETVHVPMLPIRSALASLAGEQIHWLKIDIEGMEVEALRGWDSQTLRPWIIVIEATVPLSSEPTHLDMDRLLADANYTFVYFDGLNRYYVAAEHQELVGAFSAPPNVFDNVELSGTSGSWCNGLVARHQAERHELTQRLADADLKARRTESTLASQIDAKALALAQAKSNVHELGARIAQLEARAGQAESRAAATEHHVHALLASTSWRVTRPLRFAVSAVRGNLTQGSVDRLARIARRLGIFGLARALYRALRKPIAAPVTAADTKAARSAGAASSHTAAVAGMSDDALLVFNGLKPQRNAQTGTR